MKKELLPSLLLSIVCLVFFCGVYPVVIWGIAQLAPNKGDGFVISSKGKQYYGNIAQKFTDDKYFWSRPSAVGYNAAGSGGSNKGPNDSAYLAQVQASIDTLIVHDTVLTHRHFNVADIPSDLVTASGSGLDPDISVQGALVQAPRIAKARGLPEDAVKQMVAKDIEKPLLGCLGPEKVNVLKLNIDLDNLK